MPVVVLSQTNEPDAFRDLVKKLPVITHIYITPVKPLLSDDVKNTDCRKAGRLCAPDTFPYQIGAMRIIADEEAESFAALWRGLEKDPLHQDDKCFTPDHLLLFFQTDRILLQTQVSALHRKITLPGLGVVSVAGSNAFPYHRFRSALIPDSNFAKEFEKSKRALMPKVETEITVIGLVIHAKAGLTISYDEGDILLTNVDLAEQNRIENLGCHIALKVTGKLQYHPRPPNAVSTEQVLPELFYMSRPRIEVLRVDKPRDPKQN